MIKVKQEKNFNVRKFEFKRGERIGEKRIVKVKKMNNILEVVSLKNYHNGFAEFRKISKEKYVNLTTGELFNYDLSENRSENIMGLKKSFRKLRDLINNNFAGNENELHIILTYKENMMDQEKLYNDFRAFWQRFKRKFGLDFDYLAVIEPQERGAWHYHLLVRQINNISVFIDSAELANVWGHGFVKIRNLKDIDNIGAYLSAYLTDVEVNLDSDGFLKFVDGQAKKFKKGGRLHFYPPGINLYRKSKGIIFPVVEEIAYREIKKIVGEKEPTYTQTVNILVNGEEVNSVTYQQFNLKR